MLLLSRADSVAPVKPDSQWNHNLQTSGQIRLCWCAGWNVCTLSSHYIRTFFSFAVSIMYMYLDQTVTSWLDCVDAKTDKCFACHLQLRNKLCMYYHFTPPLLHVNTPRNWNSTLHSFNKYVCINYRLLPWLRWQNWFFLLFKHRRSHSDAKSRERARYLTQTFGALP